MKWYKIIFLGSLFFFGVAHLVLAQKKESTAWHLDKAIKHASVAYEFREVETELSIVKHNENLLLNPASTIKLITGFVFLDKFGENFQFESSIYYNGKLEDDGTLVGDLIFYGSGDPSLGSSRYGKKNGMDQLLDEIVRSLQKHGITCIDGDIIVDASVFGSDCTAHSWQYNDLGNYYAAGVWSTNINENAYKLSLNRSTNRNEKVKLESISPSIPNLYFDNELSIGAENSGDQAYIFCAPYQNHAVLRGSIPAGESNFSIRGSIPNVPQFIGHLLQDKLEQNDIKSMNIRTSFTALKKDNVLWTHKGIKAKRQVRSAIHKSINLYCEAFYKKLGKGNRTEASNIVTDYLIDNKMIASKKEVKISDGSGLSQRNYISASTMVDFLIHQRKNLGEEKLAFYLARNAYHGTLKNAFTIKSLKGKIYGKSGSMGGVRAYAGFLETKSGNVLAFSIMVNNYTESSRTVYLHIQRLLETVYLTN